MQSAVSRLLIAATTLAFSAAAAAAQGMILPRPCTPRVTQPGIPGSEVPCLPVGAASIARTSTDVHVALSAGVLHYEVDERFRNNGGTIGEADYLFPLPDGAAFQDLALSIDGELVTGETLGATEARQVYEDIVRRQRDPALVEWMGYGLVRARIFPIHPGEEKRVVIRFQSVAKREGDAIRVDYFGGTAPAGTRTGPSSQGRVSLTLTYPENGTYGQAYSPTHELDVSDDQGQRVVSVRGDARDATILVSLPTSTQPAISLLANAPGGEDGFALVTIAPPTNAARTDDIVPRDVTLVLDISGSMQGAKMEQARTAGKQLLATLRPTDRFRLIDFSTDVHTFRDEFENATAANVREANQYLDALEADGSTNIAGALTEAMRGVTPAGRLPVVLFITDGEPTIGMRDPDQLVKLVQNSSAAAGAEPRRIFTFGLGTDVNVSLLEQLAMAGRGTSQFVRPDESVER
ncbi:MAG TPA: VIT domain-containing protein, partial [Gemmatimonadaceae bacterium]|nr:VIT domain-containing protein [Gemmatimonadaceae bacterium]